MRYDPTLAASFLERTPDVLRGLLLGLSTEWLDAPEKPGAWSAREVACHLADLERDAWIPRARTILDDGPHRTLDAIQRERFRDTYRGTPLAVVLDDFARYRRRNLDELSDLDLHADLLAKTGRHGSFGAVRLSELLSAWVVHDLTHLAQISRAVAAQYEDAVGPWREFLSVLHPR